MSRASMSDKNDRRGPKPEDSSTLGHSTDGKTLRMDSSERLLHDGDTVLVLWGTRQPWILGCLHA